MSMEQTMQLKACKRNKLHAERKTFDHARNSLDSFKGALEQLRAVFKSCGGFVAFQKTGQMDLPWVHVPLAYM